MFQCRIFSKFGNINKITECSHKNIPCQLMLHEYFNMYNRRKCVIMMISKCLSCRSQSMRSYTTTILHELHRICSDTDRPKWSFCDTSVMQGPYCKNYTPNIVIMGLRSAIIVTRKQLFVLSKWHIFNIFRSLMYIAYMCS